MKNKEILRGYEEILSLFRGIPTDLCVYCKDLSEKYDDAMKRSYSPKTNDKNKVNDEILTIENKQEKVKSLNLLRILAKIMVGSISEEDASNLVDECENNCLADISLKNYVIETNTRRN